MCSDSERTIIHVAQECEVSLENALSYKSSRQGTLLSRDQECLLVFRQSPSGIPFKLGLAKTTHLIHHFVFWDILVMIAKLGFELSGGRGVTVR